MGDLLLSFQYELADLHHAVLQNDEKLLKLLLSKPNIDVNKQNAEDETPLFLSLKQKRSDEFIMRLIQAGCDIQIFNADKVTPLHLAVQRRTTDIANELIKRGADINAQDSENRTYVEFLHLLGGHYVHKKTPLHYAVESKNLETVCMLLYYGADVYITSSDRSTPLKYAVLQKLNIATTLMDYYDKTYFFNESKISRLGLNNDMECEGISLLKYADKLVDPTVFKSIWYKIDQKMLWNSPNGETLLVHYTNQCMFATPDWLECLYLILRSSFIDSDVKYINRYGVLFRDLCFAFSKRNVQFNDRMTIISICLSLGIVPNKSDCLNAHLLYGFNEEFEALLHSTHKFDSGEHCFTSFIVSLDECDKEIILKICKFHFNIRLIQVHAPPLLLNDCINMLGFFSLPNHTKIDLNKIVRNQQDVVTPFCNEILKKIEQVPEFPTLLELSRNQMRRLIKQRYTAKIPYQYQDVINSFNIPQPLKDILRFKTPLY